MPQDDKSSLEGGSAKLLFVKMCFVSPQSGQTGIALIRINEGQKTLDKVDALAALNSTYTESLSTMSPAVQFEEFLNKHRFKMDFNQKSSNEIVNTLRQVIGGQSQMEKGAIVGDFIAFSRKKDVNSIHHALQPYLGRALYDKKVELQIGVEFTTQAEMDTLAAGQEADRQAATSSQSAPAPAAPAMDDFFNLGDDKVVLLSHPVLSPVTGVSISNLKPGLEVMVRIDNNNVLGNKYNTLFNLVSEDGRIQPRQGTVQAIRSDPDGHKILVHFQGNTYGKIIETEQVKIKIYEPETGGDHERMPLKSRLITIGLVAGLVVLVAILLAVFIKA